MPKIYYDVTNRSQTMLEDQLEIWLKSGGITQSYKEVLEWKEIYKKEDSIKPIRIIKITIEEF